MQKSAKRNGTMPEGDALSILRDPIHPGKSPADIQISKTVLEGSYRRTAEGIRLNTVEAENPDVDTEATNNNGQ